jgi:hypothetical protein
MPYHLKVRVSGQIRNIFLAAREIIIHAQYIIIFLKQTPA